jgi:hypothetical protein
MSSLIIENTEVYNDTKDKVYYSISHGEYTPKEENFKVPNNIRLIQFSKPEQLLSYLEVLYVIENFNIEKIDKFENSYFFKKSVLGNIYELINKINSELIYKSNVNIHITEPGMTTRNLQLNFKDKSLPLFEGYLELNDQNIVKEVSRTIKECRTLKTHLNKISKELKDTPGYDNYILNVLQFSCRKSSTESEYGIDELIRDLKATSIEDYKNLLDLWDDYYKDSKLDVFTIYNEIKRTFHITKDIQLMEQNIDEARSNALVYKFHIQQLDFKSTLDDEDIDRGLPYKKVLFDKNKNKDKPTFKINKPTFYHGRTVKSRTQKKYSPSISKKPGFKRTRKQRGGKSKK